MLEIMFTGYYTSEKRTLMDMMNKAVVFKWLGLADKVGDWLIKNIYISLKQEAKG